MMHIKGNAAGIMLAGMAWSLVAGITMRAGAADVTGSVARNGRMVADAVVTLEGEKKAQPLAKAVVDQRDKMFVPHVSVVTRGTAIQFPNNDSVFHNVYAYFDAKKFDLGMYPRGATKTVTFDKTGTVALLCNVHSDMSAYIAIVDTPYYAVTDKHGKFQIRDVAPGAYTLRVWHESGSTLTQLLQVGAAVAPLALTLGRK